MSLDPEAEKAAVRGCIAALEDARSALDEHYRWCDRACGGAHNEPGVEARKRVGQLIWLLREIEKLVTEAAALSEIWQAPGRAIAAEGADPESWFERMKMPEVEAALRKQATLHEPLEVLTEAFYWLAARTRSVVRQLPGLEKFEAEGVRNVRNHLLEHPEGKSSRVLVTSFASGGPQGPVVKGVRYDHHANVWPDKGLFVNAAEFAANLKARAEAAVPSPKTRG